jgi:hypothetical protein
VAVTAEIFGALLVEKVALADVAELPSELADVTAKL